MPNTADTQTSQVAREPLPRKPLRGTKVGYVTSDKRDKSRTVVVEFQAMHSKYGKYLRRKSTYHVHDPHNASAIGDHVEIVGCRPISKTKSWRLVRVLKKAMAKVEHTG